MPEVRRTSDKAAPTRVKTGEFVVRAAPLILLLVWTALLTATPMQDFDIWWHLKTGELILELGELPQTDWYTFVDYDKPWIDLHWGFQLLAVGLYRLGGVPALMAYKIGMSVAIVSVGWLATRGKVPSWFTAAAWILPVIVLSGRAVERPEMISYLCFALWLWIVSQMDNRPRLIWWLPLIQVIWINFHALYVLGLVVWGSVIADRIARWMARGRWGLEPIPAGPTWRTMGWVSMLLVAAAFVNPYFEAGALFPEVLYRKFSVDHAFYSNVIGEFQPPWRLIPLGNNKIVGFGNRYVWAAFGSFLAAIASALWLARWRRISVLRLLLLAGFAHLAWQAVRNINLLTIISACVLCWNCRDALRLRAVGNRGTSSIPSVHGTPSRRQHFATAAVCAVIVGLIATLFTGHWSRPAGRATHFGFEVDESRYAFEACRFAGQEGFPKRAFIAHIGLAAVYIYQHAPENLVYMDGRLEVCSRDTFEKFERIRDAMAVADKRFELLLLDQNGQLPVVILDSRYSRRQITGLYNTPGWRLVYADRAAAVFLDEPTANRLNLPLADFTPLQYPDGKPDQ